MTKFTGAIKSAAPKKQGEAARVYTGLIKTKAKTVSSKSKKGDDAVSVKPFDMARVATGISAHDVEINALRPMDSTNPGEWDVMMFPTVRLGNNFTKYILPNPAQTFQQYNGGAYEFDDTCVVDGDHRAMPDADHTSFVLEARAFIEDDVADSVALLDKVTNSGAFDTISIDSGNVFNRDATISTSVFEYTFRNNSGAVMANDRLNLDVELLPDSFSDRGGWYHFIFYTKAGKWNLIARHIG